MLFYTFNSQEERRNYGGSEFIEIQFCKLPIGTDVRKIVKVNNIKNWQNDSLYINNENEFYQEYSDIFDCGTYNNLEKGVVDIFGINYYSFDLIDIIIDKTKNIKPKEYEILIEWLNKAKEYNGFYILGL